MNVIKSLAAQFCVLTLLSGTSAWAGILDDHTDAYDNDLGPGTGGRWAGSVPFSDGNDLNGFIDFAVFTAQQFNNNFSGLGYVPTGPLVYAYQVFNTGPATVNSETISASNPASGIGQFDIGDEDADVLVLGSGVADWDFVPAISPGESSWGLAFSSPNIPELVLASSTSGDALSLATAILPVPSDTPVPEPSAMLLVMAAAATLAMARRTR
jgi:hypothetical protein